MRTGQEGQAAGTSTPSPSPDVRALLVAVVGDIHGRLVRVEEWVDQLEQARGRAVDLILSVGDVETFLQADDQRRKGVKRTMPAEFAAYATGARRMKRDFVFVAGNNEAFDDLERLPPSGEVVPQVRYLGRAGVDTLHGLRVAFLSGIWAPTRFHRPRLAPTSRETIKQAGYFRAADMEQVRAAGSCDILLLHEWPRGVADRDSAVARAQARGIRQAWWSEVGNPHAAALMQELRPAWVLCGHLHVPHAASLTWPGGAITRVACLDQTARPGAGLMWMTWRAGAVVEAGWGLSGRPSWHAGEPWDERQTAAEIACPR